MSMENSLCPCGREHRVVTRAEIGVGAAPRLGRMLLAAGWGEPILLVADANTWQAAGEAVAQSLLEAGIPCRRQVFPSGDLHTDERMVGAILMALDDTVGRIVAVGSGTINDACRFVAKRTGLPYLVVGTAPSMDGYASDVTPVNRAGMKITYPGVAPQVVVGDLAVLADAPLPLLAAGFGDLFGKVNAALDWKLAHALTGEYRCEAVAAQVDRAVTAALTAAPDLPRRDVAAVGGLMEGLVLSGLAMQMVGNSRPASGAEHHISHFWEMRDMARGRRSTLHGDKVGVATLLTLRLYEKFLTGEHPAVSPAASRAEWEEGLRHVYGALAPAILAQAPERHFDPSWRRQVLDEMTTCWQEIRGWAAGLPALRTQGEAALRAMGAPVRPADLGYARQDTLDALRWAMEVRDRFTILRLCWLCGCLDRLVEEVVDEFCQ